MKQLQSCWRYARWCIAAAIIIGVLRYVDLGSLIAALSAITVVQVLWLLLISAVLLIISVLKWRLFVRALGGDCSISYLYALYLIAYFVNLFLPSHIGGDVTRSWSLGRLVGQRQAFIATFLERCTGLVAMVLMAFVALLFTDVVPYEASVAVVGVNLLMLVGFAVVWFSLPRLTDDVPWVPTKGRAVIGALQAIQTQPKALMKAMGYSAAYHAVAVVNTLVAAQAVGCTSLQWLDVCIVLPIILLVGSLPIAPSGLGIQEGAFVFFLTRIGATPGQALGISVVLRLKTYLLGIIGGGLWWFMGEGHGSKSGV